VAGRDTKAVAEALRRDEDVAEFQVPDEVVDGVAYIQHWERTIGERFPGDPRR